MDRYRFAPSPTGPLHLGNVRTALFNWLAARHDGGTFVLRIEDTDRERSTLAHEEALLDDLGWLGLHWDEGALPGGRERGERGPYRQSRRGAHYAAAASRLTEAGLTYPCFCGDAELETQRETALAAGRPPRYDGRCRALTPEARAHRVAAGEPHALRFIAPEREIRFADGVRGEITTAAGTIGDFILLRRDGTPTYNLACVVDDAHMEITQVIRGEDHLSNTARQLMLYQALGENPPGFRHVPLILGPDRAKLSKRHGENDLRVWRARGYLPRALLNHLALLGWSAADGREILSPQELIAAFDPGRISRSAAVFDAAKLEWIAIQQMKTAPLAEVVEAVRPFAEAAPLAGPALERAVALLREGAGCGETVARGLRVFAPGPVAIDPALRPWVGAEHAPLLAAAADRLAALEPWRADAINAAVRGLGRSGRALFLPLRVAVTGEHEGPALAETLELLGRDETVQRIHAVLEGT
jgi:nondiscriminating glutamyl-tRNA synthetase